MSQRDRYPQIKKVFPQNTCEFFGIHLYYMSTLPLVNRNSCTRWVPGIDATNEGLSLSDNSWVQEGSCIFKGLVLDGGGHFFLLNPPVIRTCLGIRGYLIIKCMGKLPRTSLGSYSIVAHRNHTFALLTLLSLEVVYKNGQITPNSVTHPLNILEIFISDLPCTVNVHCYYKIVIPR